MKEILGVLVSSMHADMARTERVAMNLANLQTPGYKREVAGVLPFAAEMQAAAGALAGSREAASPLAVLVDTRPGTLRTTGQSLDVAIVGDGWFEVAADNGPAYTRKGDFRLDAGGRLVTQEGLRVMGTGGDISLSRGTAVIDASGRVFEDAAAPGGGARVASAGVGQLKVVQFERGVALQPLGNGLYAATADPVPAREGAVQVQQGALENANVNHLQEMVRLMETVRHFESLQRVTAGYDEMLAASIRKLGEA